ncbi:2-carboxy-1,4-naphthoquinone phytyltransferase, chloroplastic isoform X2 [Syzygium oleosum]|uniref:2-carboxy-1,4-naphthoquinone phytyltransferase, chloroplastic isoform X2 n=1 Tax=Syzygium oleosum TaxID=219896 RepID=UPI0024BABE80|nr:2-carboxy-1,4-naphthoquinone phytyltransferase, chloroplastic isoform X2 [Syzygium oleosum]
MLMAASFCDVNLRSGPPKLHDFLSDQNGKTSSFCRSHAHAQKLCSYSRQHKFLKKLDTKHVEVKQRFKLHRASFAKNAHSSELAKEDDISMATLIWRAIKLPIYSVALVPLTIGSTSAYLQSSTFPATRYFVLLVSSILVITWLNLSNDVYDFDTGADKNKKESVVNLIGSRTGTLVAAYLFLVLGSMGLIRVSLEAGHLRAMLLLACAIICGYIYQCPPFRLSYHGLGEPLCFAAFGPFATTAFYWLMGNNSASYLPLTGTVLCASLLVGFTTSLILFCSHFHQVEEDIKVGKISPLVRLGTEKGSSVVKVAVVALYSFLLTSGLSRDLPFTCIILCLLTLPMGNRVVSFVEENHEDKRSIFMAKYYCVRLHALFGASLAAGLVIAKFGYKRYVPRLILS